MNLHSMNLHGLLRRTWTLPPMHDAASVWNAGFIRQVCHRRGLLPDKSGVPVVVSRCARLDRSQTLLFLESLEDYVATENPVRFLDAFVGSLDLHALGFPASCRKRASSPRPSPPGHGGEGVFGCGFAALRTHSKKTLILQNSAFYPPATSLECFQRRFPTDSRQGVSRNTFPVIPDFSVVSFSPRGVKRW
jgi:hypothetical protein